ncbi:MAG: EF-hand domain-containing protein [Novosphingobium sp.]
MNKIAIGLSAAALAFAGTAMAEQAWGPGRGGEGMRNATETRADALARAAQMFDRLDVNKDGKLDPADREAMQAAMFDKIDTNKDGQISRPEFIAMHAGMSGQMGGHRMGGGMGGGDHMGGPGMGEGHMGSRGMGGMMLMRMADANHDGAVSKAEFTTAAAARFDKADANHNGALTPAERQTARQAMHERMGAMMQRRMNGGDATPPAPPPAN